MGFCGSCGAGIPLGAAFCGQCGRAANAVFANPDSPTNQIPITQGPLTQRTASAADETPSVANVTATRRGGGAVMAIFALIGVGALGAGVYVLTSGDDDNSAGASAADTSIVAESSTATTIAADPVVAASNQLEQFLTQDRPTADTLVGQWVPQLSAKRVGLETRGVDYGPIEILDDHTRFRTEYGAILVDGGAFQFESGGSPMTGWFLTMVPEPFSNRAGALKWCTDRSLSSGLCLAREFKPPNP